MAISYTKKRCFILPMDLFLKTWNWVKGSIWGSDLPYIASFCNFFSIILMTPFWIQWNPQKFQFICISSTPRKFFSSLFVFGQVLVAMNWAINCFHNVEKVLDNMIIIFDIVSMMMVNIIKGFILHMLWFEGKRLLVFINKMHKLSTPMSSTVGYLVYFICHSIIMYDAFTTRWNWTMMEKVSCQITNIVMFPIRCLTEGNGLESTSVEIGSFVKQCSWLVAFILETTYGIPELISLALVFGMWSATKSFKVKMKPEVPLEEGLKVYREQRNLWAYTNDLFGTLFLCMYIATTSYYSQLREKMIQWDEINSMVFLLENTSIFGVSGHIHYVSMKVMRCWIVSKQQDPTLSTKDQLRLLAISDEVEVEPMGFSCCFFILSYQFLGSMLGLLITYIIIIYQMKISRDYAAILP